MWMSINLLPSRSMSFATLFMSSQAPGTQRSPSWTCCCLFGLTTLQKEFCGWINRSVVSLGLGVVFFVLDMVLLSGLGFPSARRSSTRLAPGVGLLRFDICLAMVARSASIEPPAKRRGKDSLPYTWGAALW
jgi:hypothetical protein